LYQNILYKTVLTLIIFYNVNSLSILVCQEPSKEKILDDTSHSLRLKDTTRLKTKIDTVYVPPLISQSEYQYISLNNPDTITRSRFLWYPAKTFEDVFLSLPGYFLNYMDFGQIQQLSYDQLDNHYTAVLRHSRPINDLIDGSVDFNLFSRNEIQELELSDGYSNSLYDYSNVINVVSRQIFQNRPFSEISYWQDLNENLNFDGSFHKNFFNKLNFNFGIKKNSYDGYYSNSSFDQWAGRFNFNYIGSKKFNAFLYSNYSKIQRGLNDGLDVAKLLTFTKDEVFTQTVSVIDSNANETRERFDVDLGALYAYGKNRNSFTTIQLFTSNSYRRFQDTSFVDVAHWINYGAKLKSVLDIPLKKGFVLKSSSEIEYNSDLLSSGLYYLKNLHKSGRQFLLENLDLTYKNFNVNGFVKGFRYEYYDNKFYINYGFKSRYDIWKDSTKCAGVFASYNFTNRLPTYQEYYPGWEYTERVKLFNGGAFVNFRNISAKVEYYRNWRMDSRLLINVNLIGLNENVESSGINANFNINIWKINLELNHQFVFKNNSYFDSLYPNNSGNISLSYHSMHFTNKLEIKIGFNSRYFTSYYPPVYGGYSNQFFLYYAYGQKIKVRPNATLDFFVIGKINKAIFGITFENILNRAFISTSYYPNQQRGGLFSVWSRFNLTWYFLN
jgi:hypothetical protein